MSQSTEMPCFVTNKPGDHSIHGCPIDNSKWKASANDLSQNIRLTEEPLPDQICAHLRRTGVCKFRDQPPCRRV